MYQTDPYSLIRTGFLFLIQLKITHKKNFSTQFFYSHQEEASSLDLTWISCEPIFALLDPDLIHEKHYCKQAYEISVADPERLSRIPDPHIYPSQIPDLGSRIQQQ